MKGTHDLRHGVLWKQILLFALPIAATSMLQQLFNSADVAVVGQFSAQKELALAAVGAPAPLSISTSPFLPAWLWEPMWSSPA